MDYTYDFGANIKEARKSKKYTQTRLANAIGVTRSEEHTSELQSR